MFIIVNEWTNSEGITSAEVVGGKYFTSEDDAWDALLDIAVAYGATLGADEMNLVIEDPTPHISYEEYYIQELIRG